MVVSHVNPDPDSLASMLGIKALVESCQPGKPVILTVDGMIARSENRAMVELIPVPLVPVETVDHRLARRPSSWSTPSRTPAGDTARRPCRTWSSTITRPGGVLNGVLFSDIRTHLGATSTMVTGYLLEQRVVVTPQLATALLYGIESETTGYPREASSLDDGALIWLFPRADKDLLAQIRNPKLPQSHFATFQNALANAFLYDDLVVSWCGTVTQPDIIAEIADFFIRFDQVDWSLSAGVFDRAVETLAPGGPTGWPRGRNALRGGQRARPRRRPRQARRRRDRHSTGESPETIDDLAEYDPSAVCSTSSRSTSSKDGDS